MVIVAFLNSNIPQRQRFVNQSVDVFGEAKRRVTSREVAEKYGFTPNQAGFICCPFHNEKTPSLKLYPNGTWHCYGCNRGGSCIDFVGELLHLEPMDAVRQLNSDFNLGLPLDRPSCKADHAALQHRRKVSATYKDFETWRESFTRQLNECFRIAHQLRETPPSQLTDAQVLAIKWQPAFEHWSNCLSFGNLDEQMQIFRDRKEVERLCKRILSDLSDMPMKSGAA